MKEVHDIFYHLDGLKYKDKPNYGLIRDKLLEILKRELNREVVSSGGSLGSNTQASSNIRSLPPPVN